jgi:hypothetical protein
VNSSGNAKSTPRTVIGSRLRAGQAAGARSVSSYVPRLTQKAFEKYGFATAALLTDWATIVGADVASYTAPERLKWPRDVNAYGDVEDGMQGRPGATLVIRVEGARALELQHKTHQLIERINAMFGYRAVAELRFIQAPIAVSSHQRLPLRPVRQQRSDDASSPEVAAVEDEALKAALARLESSIRGNRA